MRAAFPLECHPYEPQKKPPIGCLDSYMKLLVRSTLSLYIFVALGCSFGSNEYLFQGGTMGTSWSVKIVSPEPVNQSVVQAGLQAVLDDINAKMSNWDSNSDVSVFNRASAGCANISEETAQVVEISQEISRLTDGAFDATLGPLIELWGFGAEFSANQKPDPEVIAEKLQQVGYKKLYLTSSQLCKETDSLFLNLSATAKGYGVDKAAEYLESLGFDRYMVEVGGEVRALGLNHNDELWRIGIETPLDNVISGQVQELVEVKDQALATSGDYRNYFFDAGIRYSHIIDARTGYPVPQQLASVTVLHDSAVWADGWATAMLALGAERGLELAEQQHLAVYFVLRSESGFRVVTSTAW